MSNYVEFSERVINEALDLIFGKLDQGSACPRATLKIYTSGGPNTGTLLATLTMSLPSFSKAEGGEVSSYEITPDTNASASGTAAYFELVDRNDCVVLGGSVGALNSGAMIELDKLNITAGDYVMCEGMTFRMLASVKGA